MPAPRDSESGVPLQIYAMIKLLSSSNPRALACLVSREGELAFRLRSLINRSPPPLLVTAGEGKGEGEEEGKRAMIGAPGTFADNS